MEVIQGIRALRGEVRHPVVAMGNFDGVHLGHQQVIRWALNEAQKQNGVAVVYTFRPHPRTVLSPDTQMPLLTTYDQRLELLQRLGVALVVEEPFDSLFSKMEAADFVQNVLLNQLKAKSIVVGYDFSFGRGRHGHLDLLQSLCQAAQVNLKVVPPFQVGETVVSSSKIRAMLLAHQLKEASELLGYPYYYTGVVLKGAERGRKMGFPTANLALKPEQLVLPLGVYATRTLVEGVSYSSVTNMGVRPTFQDSASSSFASPVLVETHLIDQNLDLYGKKIQVEFLTYLRPEQKFPNIDALKEQIRADVDRARLN